MPVHPDSVISTWVNDFHPSFYDSLTSKENWTYLNAPPGSVDGETGLDGWKRLYGNLNTALTNWNNHDRDVGGYSLNLPDLLLFIHSYMALGEQFPLLTFPNVYDTNNIDFYKIFNINNFIETTLANPVDWYDDLVSSGGFSPTWVSSKMSTSITQVNNWDAAGAGIYRERTRVATIRTISPQNAQFFTGKFLFIEPTGIVIKTKQEIGELFFNTLNWKYVTPGSVFPNLLDGKGIELPPYITL